MSETNKELLSASASACTFGADTLCSSFHYPIPSGPQEFPTRPHNSQVGSPQCLYLCSIDPMPQRRLCQPLIIIIIIIVKTNKAIIVNISILQMSPSLFLFDGKTCRLSHPHLSDQLPPNPTPLPRTQPHYLHANAAGRQQAYSHPSPSPQVTSQLTQNAQPCFYCCQPH